MVPNQTRKAFARNLDGFSYGQSQFNRATQAFRQPSAINLWSSNSAARCDLQKTMAAITKVRSPSDFKLEHSRNVMAAKLAAAVGMDTVMEYPERLKIYEHRAPFLSMALGSGETTMMRMVAYSAIANGALQVTQV